MKKIVVLSALALIVLGLVFAAGCAKKAEAAKCDGCGMEVAKDQLTLVGDKMLCSHCAEKAAATPAGEQLVCANCGMTMAADEMTEIDGKWYCSHCAPEVRKAAGTEGAAEQPAGEAAAEPQHDAG